MERPIISYESLSIFAPTPPDTPNHLTRERFVIALPKSKAVFWNFDVLPFRDIGKMKWNSTLGFKADVRFNGKVPVLAWDITDWLTMRQGEIWQLGLKSYYILMLKPKFGADRNSHVAEAVWVSDPNPYLTHLQV